MKTDERIQSTWTREETIYFIWKEDQRIYKINGLLKKHQDDLEALLSSLESPINILFLTETWLNENDNINMYKIKGFQTVISNSRNTRGGGTMIQLDEKVNLIDRFECRLPESVAILAEIGGNKIILIVTYIPT